MGHIILGQCGGNTDNDDLSQRLSFVSVVLRGRHRNHVPGLGVVRELLVDTS